MVQTYSGGQTVPIVHKLREWFELSRMAAQSSGDISGVLADIEEYDSYLRKHTGRTLSSARVMEFGFGARPLRQLALKNLASDASGVDRDRPNGDGGVLSYWRIFRENGFERAAKTAARKLVAGNRQRSALENALQATTSRPIDRHLNLITADLSDRESLRHLPAESFDLIVSEDVFEHIPPNGIPVAVEHAARLVTRDGIVLIRPNVFTGIMGGHLTEWYKHRIDEHPKRSEPWEHLRQRRFKANTYLNELTRADFRALFETSFEILEEVVRLPELGAHHLTSDVRAELANYSDEELFSNQVMWVLRKK